jgi:hypothetical protein
VGFALLEALCGVSHVTPLSKTAYKCLFNKRKIVDRTKFRDYYRKAYRQPDGTDVIHGTPLEEPYFAKALPVVKEQLKRAGVRLALLMNAAADGTLPPNLLQLSE